MRTFLGYHIPRADDMIKNRRLLRRVFVNQIIEIIPSELAVFLEIDDDFMEVVVLLVGEGVEEGLSDLIGWKLHMEGGLGGDLVFVKYSDRTTSIYNILKFCYAGGIMAYEYRFDQRIAKTAQTHLVDLRDFLVNKRSFSKSHNVDQPEEFQGLKEEMRRRKVIAMEAFYHRFKDKKNIPVEVVVFINLWLFRDLPSGPADFVKLWLKIIENWKRCRDKSFEDDQTFLEQMRAISKFVKKHKSDSPPITDLEKLKDALEEVYPGIVTKVEMWEPLSIPKAS
jgi:hypothetical protein